MKRNTKLYLMLIVMLVIVVGFAVSYAYFTAPINNDNSLLNTNSGKLEIMYDGSTTGSGVITLANVYPREEAWVTKEFTIKGTNTTDLAAFYKVKLAIDNNEFEGLALYYTLDSVNTGNNGNIIPSISKEYIGRDDLVLGQGYFTNTGDTAKEHKYTLKIYFKDTGEDQNYLQEAKFAAHVIVEEGDNAIPLTPQGWDEAGSGTLLAGIKTNYPSVMLPLTTPGKKASTENEAVLAASPDDYGMSYYFRGNVTNNYVEFANKCWRIVRVTGDGSIKLVLHNENVNNVSNPCDSVNNNDNVAFARYDGTKFTTAFNEQTNDNTYVGFMYGTAGSSTYAETHANINKSTILQNLETWYKNNLTSYEDKLADTIWCNDKSTIINYSIIQTSQQDLIDGIMPLEMPASGKGYGQTRTLYSFGYRIEGNYISYTLNNEFITTYGSGPTLVCPNDNDGGKLSKFTVNDTINGNGKLIYKIGLLTVDETIFAGNVNWLLYGNIYSRDSSVINYLSENVKSSYWLLSPSFFGGTTSVTNATNSVMVDENSGVKSLFGLRPAISLISTTTISGGKGTSSNPFIVN